jgi:1-acyl-sn-glycerol-3-phosphate acyltransferase
MINKGIIEMGWPKSIISEEDEQKISEIFVSLHERYKNYKDPWGFNLTTIEKAIRVLLPLYRHYFKVRVIGAEKVPDEPLILVSNHTGQIPIDAMLVTIAFFIDIAPARVLRAMIERFMVQLPFLADLTAQTGSILGDRANCQFLIEQGESILVFPEGVRGISKNTSEYYQVQPFSLGFYKIALEKRTRILPLAVIGAEEMFPFVYHAKSLAKKLALPSAPISLNLFPLPSPIDIYIGEPIECQKDLSPEAPDKDLKEPVYKIEEEIKRMVAEGLKNKRTFKDRLKEIIS